VFARRGISGASTEEIAEAAGFSRGALYSNFADKDELVLALLERFSDESVAEIDDLLARFPDPDEFVRETVALMHTPTRRNRHHHPVLSTELVLYALRNPTARPLLQRRLARSHAAVLRAIEATATARGLPPADNRATIAAMINAMDDGFALHAMIDPTRDPLAQFTTALEFIAEAGEAIAFRAAQHRT
jgi:AcrR family transcriptional regulator